MTTSKQAKTSRIHIKLNKNQPGKNIDLHLTELHFWLFRWKIEVQIALFPVQKIAVINAIAANKIVKKSAKTRSLKRRTSFIKGPKHWKRPTFLQIRWNDRTYPADCRQIAAVDSHNSIGI